MAAARQGTSSAVRRESSRTASRGRLGLAGVACLAAAACSAVAGASPHGPVDPATCGTPAGRAPAPPDDPTGCSAGDGEALVELESGMEPAELAAGGRATAFIGIHAAPGAQLSEGAPLRVTLTSWNLALGRVELTAEDSVATPDGARFAIPVAGCASGPAWLAARLRIFVCTAAYCRREECAATVQAVVR